MGCIISPPEFFRSFKLSFTHANWLTLRAANSKSYFFIVIFDFNTDEIFTVHTTKISSCFPSKFCISRRQTLNEFVVVSSFQIKEASYSLPVLRCSAVTRTTGVSLNFPYRKKNIISNYKIELLHFFNYLPPVSDHFVNNHFVSQSNTVPKTLS